jgi:hypothetical protein
VAVKLRCTEYQSYSISDVSIAEAKQDFSKVKKLQLKLGIGGLTMAEYIEREALLKEIDEECMPTNWTNSEAEIQADHDYALYRNVIEAQPTADVVEVRHGEWKDDLFLKDKYPSVKCSECNIRFCDIISNHSCMWNFCPNCGAKMDGEKNV